MDGEYTAYPEALYYSIAKDAIHTAKGGNDPFVIAQACITALVFSTLVLETFANRELERACPDGSAEGFERLGTVEKWLVLPRLNNASATFDRGSEPFQTFQEVLRVRNGRLVHYKPWRESTYFDKRDPDGFDALAHDVVFAERAVASIRGMIRELWRLTGRGNSLPPFLGDLQYVSLRRVEKSVAMHAEHVESPSDETAPEYP